MKNRLDFGGDSDHLSDSVPAHHPDPNRDPTPEKVSAEVCALRQGSVTPDVLADMMYMVADSNDRG